MSSESVDQLGIAEGGTTSRTKASTGKSLPASNSAAGAVVVVSVTTTVVAKIRSRSDIRSGLSGTGATRSTLAALGIFAPVTPSA